MKLRPYPYQIIAYLEDKSPSDHPLHCTLLRRFKLAQNMEIHDIQKKLEEITKITPSVVLTPGDKAPWSIDGEQYLIKPNKDFISLKKLIDHSIKNQVIQRDPEYDNLESLHISFDTRHKKSLLRVRQVFQVEKIAVQVDYEDSGSLQISK